MDSIPRTRQELDSLFQEIAKQALADSPDFEGLEDKLDNLSTGVSIQGIFSENEEFEDVDSGDLGFALVDYWAALAVLRNQKPGPPNPPVRLAKLQQAKALFERFLLRCIRLKLHKDTMQEEESTTKKKPESTREEKIARFKRKRAAEEAIKSAHDARERWRLRIEMAIVESLDEIDGIEREEEILNYMIKEKPVRGEPPKVPTSKPIEVTKIGPSMEMKRETFQNGVFKPYHNLPTMSVEEYGELQMKRMEEQEKEQQRREAENPHKPVLSMNEVFEKGLEDDVEKFDAAQEKARKWDDWKDDVPKGSGVTKRF